MMCLILYGDRDISAIRREYLGASETPSDSLPK